MLGVKNIQKAYGANRILNGISLNFARGSVTALVGDNGAGKSTLLKIMAGVVKPDGGHIELEGQAIDVLSAGDHRDHGIEMVFQDLALAKQHDVVTNLFMGREKTQFFFLNRKKMMKEARENLETLGIKIDDLSRPVGQLSGGQQQAVAIARAAMFNPKVLLLDEPTAALAVREVERVLELIRHQKTLGRTIILVSHRLNDVFAVSERIIVMKHGKVFADDAMDSTNLSQVVERIVG